MKNQSNFLKYAEEKYGTDFYVHQYNQFVQIANEQNSGETLSFHFNEKGFFDGAFYKTDLHDRNWGKKLFGYSNESKQYELFCPAMSEKISDIYNQIFNDMELQNVLDRYNANLQKEKTKEPEKAEDIGLEKIIFKVDKSYVFAFDDKTFLVADALTVPDFNGDITQIDGKDVIPVEKTLYKDRDVFECKQSNMLLFVDTDKFKEFIQRIGDTDKIAGMIMELVPELSKEETLDFLVEFTKPKEIETALEDVEEDLER